MTTHSGTTNTSGEFRVSFNNADSGIWSTEVTDIDGQPFAGPPVNSFDKGTDGSGTQFCN